MDESIQEAMKEIEQNKKMEMYEHAIDVIERIVTGKIKHINHQARLLHILEVIEILRRF